MNSCSGSVRSFHDEDENTPLNEKLDNFDIETTFEAEEAWSSPKRSTISDIITFPFPLIRFLRRVCWPLFAVLPSFLQPRVQKEHNQSSSNTLHATAYLDGMRGLAAFAVFLCHLSYSTFDIGHVWGAGEGEQAEENKIWLQLPIVRLFYSGPPMVAIFFVISGYALSYKPLKQMRNHDFEGLIQTLTSAVIRRPLRLYLPCFASTFIVVCLARLGFYKATEDFANNMREVHELHYWTAPDVLTQLRDWLHKNLNSLCLFDWSLYAGAVDMDSHLWTIPVEYRCSMALFLTHLLVARMSARLRISTISCLLVWGTYWNRWEMVPFWAGVVFAEIDLIKAAKREELKATIVHNHDRCTDSPPFWQTTINLFIFVVGLFLASYPDADGHVSPGYVRLTKMIPTFYTEKHRFWATIGAVMIVWSVSNLSFLRRAFTTSLAQYLGKISFPLYICHGFVIHTFTYMSLDLIWDKTDAYENWEVFCRGFIVVAICTIVVTVWISDIFLRVVDVRCVKFARWFERKLFVT